MLQYLLKWLRRCGFCPQRQSYLFLRIAKKQRWELDNETGKLPTVEEAVKDLKLRPEEKGLSLYRLHNKDEADELACIYSVTLRDNPAHFEYVLFPDDILLGYQVAPVPVPERLYKN